MVKSIILESVSDSQSLRPLAPGTRAASPRKEGVCCVENALRAFSTQHTPSGERRRCEQAIAMEIRHVLSKKVYNPHQRHLFRLRSTMYVHTSYPLLSAPSPWAWAMSIHSLLRVSSKLLRHYGGRRSVTPEPVTRYRHYASRRALSSMTWQPGRHPPW